MSNARDKYSVHSPTIHLTSGRHGGSQLIHEIDGVVTVLGSGDGCDMVLASGRVDSAHAVIVRLGGGAFVCDLGAPGGTQINDRHVRWSRIEDGDELTIGPFTYEIKIGATQGAPSTGTRPFSLRNDLTIGQVHSEDPVILIGSDAACDVVLNGSNIAPRHAIVVWTSEGPVVRDLQGRVLVRLNGRPIREGIIESGDSIGVGPYEMRFDIEAKTPAASVDSTSAVARRAAAEFDRARSLYDEPSSRRPMPQLKPVEASIPYVTGPDDYEQVDENEATRELVQEMDRLESEDAAWGDASDADPTEALDDSEVMELLEEVEVVSPSSAHDGSMAPHNSKQDGTGIKSARGPRTLSFSPDELVAARVIEDKEQTTIGYTPAFRERVIAAQNALDERARKLREELDAERQRLRQCQDQLQEQAQKLFSAARNDRPENSAGSSAEDLAERTDDEHEVSVSATRDEEQSIRVAKNRDSVSSIDRLFATTGELPASDRNVRHTRQVTEEIADAGERARVDAMSLQAQVNELMEIARDEQGGMRDAEGRLESLRFEIERLRSEVARAREKHQVQSAEQAARFEGLERSLHGVKQERESLMLRLRRLDAKESALNTRIADAKRVKKDMEREANRLARLQEEHDDRLRELRINLEGERHRLRLRQTELQKRAGELAKLARTRRHAIEEIVREQQSALQDSEADIKAKRTAIAEAGRAELEKTATELEQLLSVRLSDVESELLSRQDALDSWIRAIWDSAKPKSGESKKFETLSRTSKAALGIEEKLGMIQAEAPVRHLAQLETELENLHRAVLRMEDDSDQRGGLDAFSLRGSTWSRDRRIGGETTSRIGEKFSSFRIGAGGTGEKKNAWAKDLKPVEGQSSTRG